MTTARITTVAFKNHYCLQNDNSSCCCQACRFRPRREHRQGECSLEAGWVKSLPSAEDGDRILVGQEYCSCHCALPLPLELNCSDLVATSNSLRRSWLYFILPPPCPLSWIITSSKSPFKKYYLWNPKTNSQKLSHLPLLCFLTKSNQYRQVHL